ncbi:HAD superfamily hydrolase (TIGR01458 family) [Litorivivens lipolytica]|uniref:Haloacid dehalogenase-like hydrolase domain-containing protein 2 n=1 Tax=Litorivivens lipolytica TaxID=1524264 RepID=A0A7W4W868_9GAMM|nr:TIGR01458 family HAD-type hydrolase [Litorivivens lipolytica]MBB3048612.1 HAD superfamily hydrolase (TIGR01458 family) [Litorivivens lipolytica]
MVRGVLLDISGVLYQDDEPLPGAVAAVQKLQQAGIDFRLLTNTSRRTAEAIYYDLKRMGFAISEQQLYTAPRAMLDYLQLKDLRPYCLMHPNLETEFARLNHTNPNAVVVCDAGERFDYKGLNKAFQVLMNDGAELLAIGENRYFRSRNRLQLDAGPFVKALEYASGKQAKVLGKPAKAFFDSALHSLNLPADEVLMVGDDVESDVSGAQRAGLRACLVKTGKYRVGDEASAPDALLADDLLQLVEEQVLAA